MTLTSPGVATAERQRIDSLAIGLVIAIIVLAPIARGWVLWSAPGGDEVNQWVLMTPLDWPLALLVVLQLASVLEDRRIRPHRPSARLPPHVRVLIVTLGWMLIAAAIHPSWRALDLAFRLVGVWAIVRTVRLAQPDQRRRFLIAVVSLGAIQAVIGIAQSLTGEALGLGALEFEGPLYEFGGVAAGRGSLTHPYHLCALLVVCIPAAALLTRALTRRAGSVVLLAMVLMSTALVLTFSRSGFLAVGAMVVLWGSRRNTAAIAAAVVVGLLIGGSLGLAGISARAEVSTNRDQADSGRLERLREAATLANQEPIFGVGPGRYVIALRDVEHEELLPAHNVVAQQAAETGYPGGALVLATLAAFGLWILRQSRMTVAIGLSLLPFHVFDTYPHSFPLGIVVSGIWLALVAAALEGDKLRSERP